MVFQRARNEEQREARRKAILDTAATMLIETPVSAIRLHDLSSRVGMSKSNVLRYFESREAVLLELLDCSWQDWNSFLSDVLPQPADDLPGRCARLTQVYVDSLVLRPMLCDLFAAQAGVLERTASIEVAARFKERAFGNSRHLVELVRQQVPEIGRAGAAKFSTVALVSIGGAWTHSQPPPTMLGAYERHPELAKARTEFSCNLQETLDLVLVGLLAKTG